MSIKFIPQALADPASRAVLFVWHDEEIFRRYWADKVKTIDAPGVSTHPRFIKVGDVIDWFATGWNRATVKAVKFTPDARDIPDYHRSGTYTFKHDRGFSSIRVDGRQVIDAPMHVFPVNDQGQMPGAESCAVNSGPLSSALQKVTVGLCGVCGGNVQIPACWSGACAPLPTCEHCHSIAKLATPALRVLPMEPRNLC